MDYSPPGSSVHGISWARILEWVAISFFRGSSRPRDWTCLSYIAGRFFTIEPLPKNSTRSSLCIWNEIQNGKTLHDFAPSASPTIFIPGFVPTTLDFILFLKTLNLFFPRSLCTCCSLCRRLSPPLLVSAFSWSCLSLKVREAHVYFFVRNLLTLFIAIGLVLRQEPFKFSSVQLLSPVRLFATPWTAACQASVSITNSRSLLKLMSIVLVTPSNHLILCRPLLLLPSIFPSIRVFSNESVLHIRWPKFWSFSFSISPSNEYSGQISFRMDWLHLLAVQGTLKSLPQHHSSKASILQNSTFFIVQLSHPHMTTGKTIALTMQTFVDNVSAF